MVILELRLSELLADPSHAVVFGLVMLLLGGAVGYLARGSVTAPAPEAGDLPEPPAAKLFVAPGHFYSPICDVAAIDRAAFVKSVALRRFPGIDMKSDAQRALFETLSTKHFSRLDLVSDATPGKRYYAENGWYLIGDATILASLIREYAPKRIIEVGSGFSSAVMLDTLDALALECGHAARCTFIDPYPERLHSILEESDRGRVEIIESGIQAVDTRIFADLQRNDILFLDTTHVCKTESDVLFELFEILPRLAPGVIVHFHDVFAYFEYPEEWVFDDNRSWNEIYMIRAFLMNNTDFEILFYNDQFVMENTDLVEARHPGMRKEPGGGLWLRRV